MTCIKYLSIIVTSLLPPLSSSILIGNILSKVALILKKHTGEIKFPVLWTPLKYALWE